MAFNGSGVYSLAAGNPVVTGTTISSTWANNTLNDIATGLTTALCKDGQSTPTANIKMGTFKFTGLGAGTLAGDSVRYEQLPSASNLLPVASGGTGGTDAPTARTNLGVAPRATRIDVASVAGTVDLTANSPNTDDIRITGVFAITAFTVITDRVLRVVAGGAFTLTNGAGLTTQTGANIVCSAGDTFMIRATAANTVEILEYSRAGNKVIAQIQTYATGALATGTTVIPFDDTIPQNTEGDQYMSLAITPTNANSILEIEVEWIGSHSVGAHQSVALFQDANANALAVACMTPAAESYMMPILLKYEMTAGSVSATTFKVRAGNNAAGTTSFNGSSGARVYGGVLASQITIKEYLP